MINLTTCKITIICFGYNEFVVVVVVSKFFALKILISSPRVAFVRFSTYGDALKVLRDMDGFNFQGFSLIINPAIERNGKASEDAKKQSKQYSAKKKAKKRANSATAKSIEDKSPPKNELQTVQIASSEDWETDGGLLSPKSDVAGKNKFFGVENSAGCISKMNDGYPIYVSNFPPGTAQVSGSQKQIQSNQLPLACVQTITKL